MKPKTVTIPAMEGKRRRPASHRPAGIRRSRGALRRSRTPVGGEAGQQQIRKTVLGAGERAIARLCG